MQRSPYTPGQAAQEVYGRDRAVNLIRREFATMSELGEFVGRIHVFVGPRGVGKTSLLRVLQGYATQMQLDCVWITAGDGDFFAELVQEVSRHSKGWSETVANKFARFIESTTLDFKVFSVRTRADGEKKESEERISSGRHLQELLMGTGKAALEEKKKGFVLFIDEIQEANAQGLRALAYAWQHMQSEAKNIPMMVVSAGLSHTSDVVTDAVSFAERFRYVSLGNLDDEASRKALIAPAERKGVSWEDSAIECALEIAKGYPFFLQLIGDLAWQEANDPDPSGLIELSHVNDALAEFSQERNALFRSRWVKATPAEAEMLIAMAQGGGEPIRRSDLAALMGVKSTDISMARRSLMDKGLLESSQRGYLEFSVPGFAQFVQEIAE